MCPSVLLDNHSLGPDKELIIHSFGAWKASAKANMIPYARYIKANYLWIWIQGLNMYSKYNDYIFFAVN